MRIGILTLPLHTNYGGILQAYALQISIQRLGHECIIINRDIHQKTKFLPFCMSFVKRVIKRLMRRPSEPLFKEYKFYKEYPTISRNTDKFIKKNIHVMNINSYDSIIGDFDGFVVGSDQVWRPKYFGKNIIQHAYLAFASRFSNCKRIAYAASFGSDNWEYTKEQTIACSRLAKNFNHVAVREQSGVDLCQRYLKIDATVVLDPTMLLSKTDYENIINSITTEKPKGDLLTYILNPNYETMSVINSISKALSLTLNVSNSRYEDYGAPLEEKIQIPVEQWLRNFRDAKFVVTDSFHACVFSILFHKEFIVIGNKKRGLARFDTLLSIFGLQERMIDNIDEVNNIINKNIDWDRVQHILESEKVCSLNYLKESLE